MKKIAIALAALFFVVPSVSFAAGLTSQQASSLIAVVQSSPSTPASVFVPFITSFSNITVSQATSLIAVVQAASNTPASAFVNLLVSFTVDTSTAQPVTKTTWTTPSGAVIGADGTVLSAPQQQNYAPTTQVQPAVCQNNAQITQLEYQISQLRKKAAGQEAGDLSTGTSMVGQGNAQRDAQIEMQQEAPLQQQLQQLNSTCQASSYVPTQTMVQPTPPSADPQIASMSQDLLKLAKSFVTGTCPSSPIIVVQPQVNAGLVSIIGDTITWNSSSGQEDVGYDIYDPCVSPNDLTWSYISPMVSVNGSPSGVVSTVSSQPGRSWNLGSTSNYFSNGEGVGEAAFPLNSTSTQVLTITATEPGGGQTTKTITNIFNQ